MKDKRSRRAGGSPTRGKRQKTGHRPKVHDSKDEQKRNACPERKPRGVWSLGVGGKGRRKGAMEGDLGTVVKKKRKPANVETPGP